MKITVLGGGHGCYAAAADLTRNGHTVTLWRRDRAALQAHGEQAELTVMSSNGDFTARPHRFTADIGEAVRGAELILVPLPATAQKDLAEMLAPHLSDGQVIYLTPGSFGAYCMARDIWRLGNRAKLAFAETGTLPYLTRKHGPTLVSLTTRATNLPTGVFPATQTAHALSVIQRAFPVAHAVEDALSGALLNAGPVIHPPLIIMNAGPLNRSRDFDIHNEGTQPLVRQVTHRLDAERMAVREALGYSTHHYPLIDHYEGRDWMYGPKSHSGVVNSGNWREPIDLTSHRYMREDVAIGLAFLASVGDWAQVSTPIAHGLLALGGAVCGESFADGPRTIAGLGLGGERVAAFQGVLQHGFH